MSKCNHIGVEIIAVTSFGHGDSTTKTHAKCKKCGETGKYFWDRGFPAEYDTMRKAQASLIDK